LAGSDAAGAAAGAAAAAGASFAFGVESPLFLDPDFDPSDLSDFPDLSDFCDPPPAAPAGPPSLFFDELPLVPELFSGSPPAAAPPFSPFELLALPEEDPEVPEELPSVDDDPSELDSSELLLDSEFSLFSEGILLCVCVEVLY